MLWLVLTVILVVVGVVGLFVGFGGTTDGAKFGGFATMGICILIWLVLTVALSVHGVGTKQAGLVYNFAGVLSDQPKASGIVWTAPWQHIKTVDIGVQSEEFDLSIDADNAAVSKDQQPISARISCNYQVSPKNIITLYRTVGSQWKTILLDARALQDFKEVTAGFTAAEITTKRPELRAQTTTRLQNELNKYDITNIQCFIKNLGYTPEYRAAVNAKNVQVQQALQAEAKVAQSKAEADQEVALAEGSAKATIAKAEGKAKANKLLARSLTQEVLTQNAIDTLNKNVQVIYVPAGSKGFLIPQVAGGK